MKRLLILLLLAVTIAAVPNTTFAQEMMGTQTAVLSASHTTRE